MEHGEDEIARDVDAELVIKSLHRSPEEMIELVGLEPHRQWRLGDENPALPEDSRFRIYRTSGVVYGSGLDPDVDTLDDLLSFLREHEAGFKRATTHPAIRAEISVGSYSGYDLQDFTLSAGDIQFLARLEVSLWIVCGSLNRGS